MIGAGKMCLCRGIARTEFAKVKPRLQSGLKLCQSVASQIGARRDITESTSGIIVALCAFEGHATRNKGALVRGSR